VTLQGAYERDRKETLWLSAARWWLIAAILAAPLGLGAVQPWAWGALDVLLFVAFLLWLSGIIARREFIFVWSPLYIPAALFLLLGLGQLAFHVTLDWTSTRDAVLKLFFILLVFFLANQLLVDSPPRTLHRLGAIVCGYAFLLSMFALLQLFSSQNKIYWSISSLRTMPMGSYVNRNHYDGLMEMLVPVAASYVALRRARLAVRLCLGFMVLIPVVSVLISGSRAGVITICCEAFFGGALIWQHVPKASRRFLFEAVAALSLVTVVFVLWLISADASRRLIQAAHIEHKASELSVGSRITVSLDSVRMLKDHPWLGVGLGSFEVAFTKYQSFASDLLWDHAHNDYAEALAETGVAGGVLVIVALIMFFRLALGKLRSKLASRTAWIQLGAAVGCVGLLLHSLVDFNLHIPANAGWFVVLTSIACGPILRNQSL
jgi:O-antigen ligase